MTAQGMLRAGAALLWRRQRVLWWLFAADVGVGLLASIPFRGQLRALNASIAAQAALYHEFNLFRLDEALSRPDAPHGGVQANAMTLGLVYFVFLLFAVGGVLESLYTDRTPRFSEFLRSSASYFWRMVRLFIVFAVLMIPLVASQAGIGPATDWLQNRSSYEPISYLVPLAINVVLILLALAVRVWIDMAQLECVAHERRAIRHSLGRARRVLKGGFWRIYGSIVAIQLLLVAFTLVLLWIWTELPHEAIGRTFLIGQLIVLGWIAARLWQKATEIAYYHQRHLVEQPVFAVDVHQYSPAGADEPAPDPAS